MDFPISLICMDHRYCDVMCDPSRGGGGGEREGVNLCQLSEYTLDHLYSVSGRKMDIHSAENCMS